MSIIVFFNIYQNKDEGYNYALQKGGIKRDTKTEGCADFLGGGAG